MKIPLSKYDFAEACFDSDVMSTFVFSLVATVCRWCCSFEERPMTPPRIVLVVSTFVFFNSHIILMLLVSKGSPHIYTSGITLGGTALQLYF